MPTLPDASREQVKQDLYRRFSRRGRWRMRARRFLKGLSWVVIQSLSSGKRVVEWFSALIFLVVLLPLYLITYALVRLGDGHIQRIARLGRWCEPFDEYRFSTSRNALGSWIRALHLDRLPALFNILKGDMSFIGPRVVSAGEISPRERLARKRYNVRPGLICLWWIRRRANIAYQTEVEADGEYVDTQSVWGDLGITLRSIPAVLYGEGVVTAPDELTILGLPIHNITMSEAIDRILLYASEDTPRQICFINADCANLAYINPVYRRILQTACLALADGIGLKMAGKLLGRDIKQNVNGTDLFPRLCERLSDTGHALYLLGAAPGVAEQVRHWVERHYPGVRINGVHHGYFTPEQEPEVMDAIARSGSSLLLVAFGAPRQDIWIHERLEQTGVSVAMGVGGLFDFYSGRIPRAPQWVREMGLEWVYRLYREPRRLWKRYGIGNAIFLFRVMKEKWTHELS